MIAGDQPTCFPDDVIAGVSSRDDGTMLDKSLDDRHHADIVRNRHTFCEKVGIAYSSIVYQIIRYDSDLTYDMIAEVDRPDSEGVFADVLYTEKSGLGLFLPVADCVAAILYDPERNALALAHIGRHASIAKTMMKTIDFFAERGSDPSNLTLWMAPSVGKDSYRMDYFDHKDDPDWREFASERSDGIYLDLAGFNRNLARKSGVPDDKIYSSDVDTATDASYFSHSQGDKNGRFAVVAMMR